MEAATAAGDAYMAPRADCLRMLEETRPYEARPNVEQGSTSQPTSCLNGALGAAYCRHCFAILFSTMLLYEIGYGLVIPPVTTQSLSSSAAIAKAQAQPRAKMTTVLLWWWARISGWTIQI